MFRETYLRPTETFVRDHLLGLRRWRPEVVTVGLRPDRLEVPGVPVHLVERSSLDATLRWRLAKLTGGLDGAVLRGPVRAAIEAVHPAVVHAHFGPDAAFADLALRRSRLPLVATFHGYDATVRPEVLRTFKWSARQLVDEGSALLRRLAAIIAVSGPIRDALVARGAPAERITVIPCGVRTDAFPWSPPPERGPVLFVGRLVAKKGPTDLVRAMAGIPDAPPLVVIGTGPDEPELRRLAGELGVRLDLRGHRSTGEVRAAMQEAVLVAMPSQTASTGDMEGMPVVSVEAAASGRPVVGYRHSGLVDSVLDGRTGLLYPERDVVGLRGGLTQLLADPGRRLAFSRAGRAHVEQHFELASTLARVEDVYDAARERSPARA